MLYIADAEANSLTPDKFYCLCYSEPDSKEILSATTYQQMREIISNPDNTIVMHNGVMWDKPNLSRVLGVPFRAAIIDTLFLSWYLFPNRLTHGIESWGEDFGIPKPVIHDWQNLTLDEYVHRCKEDVKIGKKVWQKIVKYLSVLYEVNLEDVPNLPIVKYLTFKAEAAATARHGRWKLDRRLCEDTLASLYVVRDEKIEGLKKVMPNVVKYKKVSPPAKPYKKDGSLSAHGLSWQLKLHQLGLPETFMGDIQVEDKIEPPNPGSHAQIKDWLFSLGWLPATYKYEREDDGSMRKIPQIRTKEKLLCPSVQLLIEKEPAVALLDGLSVAQHRIAILEGFLSAVDEDDYVYADIQGLTNTLRFKHKVIVNLPGVDKPYGKEIRGALRASDQAHELCGSDMSSLENLTGDHYISIYDAEYVKEKNQPGYDPHIEMCVMSGLITKDEGEFYKWYQTQNH